MKKQARQSNFEILRILSMTMIVAFHSIYFSNISFDSDISVNKLLYNILYYFGELGVNCFILISGYFLTDTTFKWKKLVLMILQVYFYFYGCRIATIIFTKAPIDAYDLSSWFFPVLQGRQYWFVSMYIFVYLITPFLQKLIASMYVHHLSRLARNHVRQYRGGVRVPNQCRGRFRHPVHRPAGILQLHLAQDHHAA